MRLVCLLLALLLAAPVIAQEQPVKKKQVAAKKKPRPQATPEQIRRFNELQKKQQATKLKQ